VQQELEVAYVRFTPARGEQQRGGLLGWVRCCIGDAYEFDGIRVRRGRDEPYEISFPSHSSESGMRHAYVRLLRPEAAESIKRQIIEGLRRQGYVP
jgi:hypothetical protein